MSNNYGPCFSTIDFVPSNIELAWLNHANFPQYKVDSTFI